MTARSLPLNRNRLYALIEMGCAQLHIDESTKRDMFFTITRQRSKKDMDVFGLNQVLNHLTDRGFVVVAKTPARKHESRVAYTPATQAAKIRELWTSLSDTGRVKDSSDRALRVWTKNTSAPLNSGVGIDDPRMLPAPIAQRLIERLKQWLAR